MNFIKHIIEFDKLHLVWQSEENDPYRLRYVVAEITRNGDDVQLKYLTDTPDFQLAQSFGFSGYPAFNMDKDVHSSGVLEAFMRRLPPRNREDFGRYLEMLRLPAGAPISDFALLGYSGAKLPGDEFSIIPSFAPITQPFEFLMEVAGFRFKSELPLDEVKLHSDVSFAAEPANPVDATAIMVVQQGKRLGYVIRTLLPAFHHWLRDGRIQRAIVERKNGQIERPTLYVLIEVKSQ